MNTYFKADPIRRGPIVFHGSQGYQMLVPYTYRLPNPVILNVWESYCVHSSAWCVEKAVRALEAGTGVEVAA